MSGWKRGKDRDAQVCMCVYMCMSICTCQRWERTLTAAKAPVAPVVNTKGVNKLKAICGIHARRVISSPPLLSAAHVVVVVVVVVVVCLGCAAGGGLK